ncbi:lipoprotein [Spirochaetia bacterium]|nr:lipoprotein [Spirochaetia bacterium]
MSNVCLDNNFPNLYCFLMKSVYFFLVLLCVFSSCKKEETLSIDREDLFSLDIGRLEDQLGLYDLQDDRGRPRADLAMRDGFFYITDAIGQKVVQFNSYGQLLFMIYNEETNPPPLSLKPLELGGIVTRWAASYPFREPGLITVDSRKHIYVQDLLPPERRGFDRENQALLESTILHFDAEGRFVEYLGQEGIGGTPFPRVEDIYVSVRDELAVVCRLPTGWNVYWFDSKGALLYSIRIANDAVPLPPDWPTVIPSLDAVVAAPDERKLYLKVDYYRDTFDESTNTRTGNENDSSMLWIMNVEDGSWDDRVELPFYEYSYTENNRRQTIQMFYSLLGIIRGGRIFLSIPVEGGYSLLIMSAGGSEHSQGFIKVDDDELQFNAFDLSGDGILSALLVDDWKAKLVWWRTDRIVGGEIAP